MVFEWDPRKNLDNINKHGVSFKEAQKAFFDHKRIIKQDVVHSTKNEKRYFCLGKVKTKVLTVRFTIRKKTIRIFGAGFTAYRQKTVPGGKQGKKE